MPTIQFYTYFSFRVQFIGSSSEIIKIYHFSYLQIFADVCNCLGPSLSLQEMDKTHRRELTSWLSTMYKVRDNNSTHPAWASRLKC